MSIKGQKLRASKRIKKLLAEDMKKDSYWDRGKKDPDLIGKPKGPIKFVKGGSCNGK